MLPTAGLLEPGQTCRVKVTFQPLMAVIYEVHATCWYGEGSKQKSSIQLQATGEAHLSPVPEPTCCTFLALKGSGYPRPHLLPRPYPHETSTSFLPPPPALRHFLFFASRGVVGQCFPGDTYHLRGAAQLGLWRP